MKVPLVSNWWQRRKIKLIDSWLVRLDGLEQKFRADIADREKKLGDVAESRRQFMQRREEMQNHRL